MDDDTTIHKYYADTKATIQRIKALAKQSELYNGHWEAINRFIDEDALAAFISGLKKPYFGYAQAAKPKDVEDAYAFLCKFASHEKTASKLPNKIKTWEKRDQVPNTGSNFPSRAKSVTKVEPMDVDQSLRSRLTLNKKLINNNEAVEVEEEDTPTSESESDSTDEEADEGVEFVNFRKASLKDPPK